MITSLVSHFLCFSRKPVTNSLSDFEYCRITQPTAVLQNLSSLLIRSSEKLSIVLPCLLILLLSAKGTNDALAFHRYLSLFQLESSSIVDSGCLSISGLISLTHNQSQTFQSLIHLLSNHSEISSRIKPTLCLSPV